ncbi:hypothetical protein [Microcoleus sp. F4-D5]|uniref:hypothetical protein n=1 Tax=Microcoleus sp. F4-D5 TaxID=2818760 RepID=UPI002FD48D36
MQETSLVWHIIQNVYVKIGDDVRSPAAFSLGWKAHQSRISLNTVSIDCNLQIFAVIYH